MPFAIRIHEHGGPEVLRWEEFDPGPPAAHEVRIRHTAIGVNFTDVYSRTGLYPGALPGGVGAEAAGVIEAIGRKVTGFRIGDRVMYMAAPPRAYCEVNTIAADRVLKIPRGIDDEIAAAGLLKGLTAQYLLRRTYRVKAGDTLLVTAAAGGMGLILGQWASHLGARAIGITSTQAKARLARRHGYDKVLIGIEDMAARVRKLTRGEGVDVVYDSVGKDTFFESLDSLRLMGMMVSYGNASGVAPAVSPGELQKRGSLFLTRPTGIHYFSRREWLVQGAREFFKLVQQGTIRVEVKQRYRLADAAQAHRDLEARRTVGSSVLIP
ncbi:MAG: quinone oxidoreductase [Gammaproteobacteria bacterium]|nr:quinone oxidoreductase [Gammaproteobacteria bacterium]